MPMLRRTRRAQASIAARKTKTLKAKEQDSEKEEDSSASSEDSTTSPNSRRPATDNNSTTITSITTSKTNITTNSSEDSNTTSRTSRSSANNINNARVSSAQGDGSDRIITRRRGRPAKIPTTVEVNLGDLKLSETTKQQEQDDVDVEEEVLKSEASSEEGDPSNIVVISNIPEKKSEGEEEGQEGNNSAEEVTSSVGSVEEGPSEGKSFCIVVNPDGSLVLVDESKIDQTEYLTPDKEKFSVTLPKNKLKSPNNPLPGAVPIPVHRSRKSKPEVGTYGESSASGGVDLELISAVEELGKGRNVPAATMSVGINQAHTVIPTSQSAVPIDIDEFTNQLDPQSLATLENLIQSQQDIIESYDMQQAPAVSYHVESDQDKAQNWDKSASASSSVTGAMSPTSSADNSPAAFGGRGKGAESRSRASSSRLSESDASIRRSQRQQDRIEKQEAERILAENQEMLKREKEIMRGAQLPPKGVSPKKIETPYTSPLLVTPKAAPVVARAASSVISTRDSIDSTGSDRKPYPKRENRRLPAHLADPNYISLEEEGQKLLPSGALLDKSPGSRRSSVSKSEDDDDDEEYIAPEAGDDVDYAEDDPNKLWCICMQPHNNRFMICCDTCEEWFHGKCVGVTKAQGKAMELKNILWVCPPCKKKESEKRKSEKAAERASHSHRRSDGGRLSKTASAQQADAAAAAIASKTATAPEKLGSRSIAIAKKNSVTLTHRDSRTEKSEGASGQGCVVCSKPARKDSIYCSDQCVQKHAENLGNKAGPVEKATESETPSTPASSSPTKLKRTNSKVDAKSAEPIFNFHKISSGATSTEVVPAKTKEITASQILKGQKDSSAPQSSANKQGLSVPSVSPNSVTAIISSTPTVVVTKITNSEGKSIVKLPGKISKDSPLKIESHTVSSEDKNKSSKARNRTPSQSESKNKTTSNRKSDSIKPRSEKDEKVSEKMHRENIRKALREILKTRMKEMNEDEQRKVNDGAYNPVLIAEKIEEELCRVYGGANNQKCRTKYRTIYFNLKDTKNLLYQELLNGSLKPKVFVKMEAHEMAPAELADWRKKEAHKELEAIKKSELDKIAESQKIQLLEKGIDDAVTVAEELRPHDISDVIDQSGKEKDSHHSKEKDKDKHHVSTSDKSKSSSHGHSSSKRDKDSKSHHNKEKDKDKDKRRSDRHKSEKDSSHRDKDRRSSSHRDKDKVKHSDSKHKSKELHRKDSLSQNKISSGSGSGTDDQSKSPASSAEQISVPEVISPTSTVVVTREAIPPPPPPIPSSSSSKATVEIPQSTELEQELPSSTIKTPDFAEELSTKKEPKHLFETKIVMPELGTFSASAHAVSHASVDGLFFPPSPVNIVGRIPPETVWDYVNKMKKSKEVIVFRLSPASPADSEGYMTFFSYFSSRSRLGVMGGIVSPLKDVYLVPLPKQAPVPRALLPFRGPGLPTERTHCLLCVVTRNIREQPSITVKRKASLNLSVDQPLTSKKRAKLEDEKKNTPPQPINDDDDDAPYTPWEEEESSNSNSNSNSDPQPPPKRLTETKKPIDVQKQLRELEAKIAKEKQDIEKITGALAGRSNLAGIPGLDGEFAEAEADESSSSSAPSEIIPIVPVPVKNTPMGDPRLRKRQRLTERVDDEPVIVLPGKGDVDMRNLKSACSADVDMRNFKPIETEVMDISSEDSSVSSTKDDVPSVKVVAGKTEDLEEAYSPSAIQFSDEETSDSLGKKQDSTSNTTTPVEPVSSTIIDHPPTLSITSSTANNDEEEEEPLPPGVDVIEIPTPVFKPIPALHVDDIKITMPKLSEKPVTTAVSDTVKQASVDLEENIQQPLRPPVKKLEEKSDTVFDKPPSSALPVLPATKISSIGAAKSSSAIGASKMKININLTTKQLPSASDTPNTEGPASKTDDQHSDPIPPAFPLLPPVHSTTFPTRFPVATLSQPPPPLGIRPETRPLIHQPQSTMPFHIPPLPPTLAPTRGPANSVVINLNIPPPPIPRGIIPPPQQESALGQMRFPPTGIPFSPTQQPRPLTMPPAARPNSSQPFTPSFGAHPNQRPMPPGSGPEFDRESFGGHPNQRPMPPGPGPEFDRDRRGLNSNDDMDRVQRVNLDSGRVNTNNNRDGGRSFRGGRKDMRGRGGHRNPPERNSFGRRRFERSRSPVERVRRRRSQTRSGEKSRSRSRSRSPRRTRKRSSEKSRSKSPLSRRYEAARNLRNRSRSRSAGRRGRNRSRSPSPRRRRSSRSPARNARKARSPSPNNNPPSPLLKNRDPPAKSRQESDEDWEADDSKTTAADPTVSVIAEDPIAETSENAV